MDVREGEWWPAVQIFFAWGQAWRRGLESAPPKKKGEKSSERCQRTIGGCERGSV